MARFSDTIWEYAIRDDSPVIMEDASQIVEWTNRRYHKRFLRWLRESADAPIDPKSAHMDLIVANAMVKTMREVRKHLLDLEERAHSALELEKHER